MADITGSSGQPTPSNPLLSQQGGVPVNTQAAQRTMEDLAKAFDSMTKAFGANFDKVTKDSMAAEERFYRAVGDKAKERQMMVNRHSKEAIANIEAEKNARVDALEAELILGKRTYQQIESDRIRVMEESANRQINIKKEAEKKIAQGQGISGLVRGATSFVGGTIGGSIGGLVTGIGELVANPATAIPAALVGSILEMANTAAAFNTTGSQLAGAGFKLGTGGATGINFASQLFGGPFGSLGQALSQDQQRDIIAQMSGSRTMVDQTRSSGGFGAVRNNLGLFANILPDASKEMALFTDATKNLGMSQKDISDTFVSSRINAERLKITQLDAISAQMEMQKALRNITNDGAVAAGVLSNITDYLNKIGASEAEKARIGVAIGQAGANLPFSSIVGMSAFLNNGKIPTPEAMFGMGAYGVSGSKVGVLPNVFQTLGGFLTKVGSQFHDPTSRMLAASQLQQQYLPGLRTQDIPQFFNLANSMMRGGKGIDFEKQFKVLEGKTPQAAMVQGIDRLAAIVGPIQRLEHVFTNFWTMLDDRWNRLLDAIHNPFKSFHIGSSNQNVGKKASGQSGKPTGASGSY